MRVVAVHLDAKHRFSKSTVESIELVAGHGVRGDAHSGATVKHRSRIAKDATRPNLRQVHLIHEELLAEVRDRGFVVRPGQLGENITTRGIDLLGLGAGTRLAIGSTAVVEVTGLRNPCSQIDKFQTGLLAAVLERAEDGSLVRKTGVMGVVVEGGTVRGSDPIRIVHEPEGRRALEPV